MMTRSNQLKGTNKASFDRFDRKLAFVSYSVVLSPNDITLCRPPFSLFYLSHCEATKFGAEKEFAAGCLLMKRAYLGLSRKSPCTGTGAAKILPNVRSFGTAATFCSDSKITCH